jgi:(S)-mandelate dehydrogenase
MILSGLRVMFLKRKYRRANFFSRQPVTQALCIEELRQMARRRLPNFAFEYLDGGAEDEASLRHNRAAFEQFRLIPKTLVDTGARQQGIDLFGRQAKAPLVIAPTGLNGLYSHEGDLALARAAAEAGIPFTVSTVSNLRLEEIAEAVNGRLWLQLYVMKDRDIARDMIKRAKAAEYEALVFTTDANVFGHREWDKRSYRAPGKLNLRNQLDVLMHPRWALDVMLPHGIPPFGNIADYIPPEARSGRGGVAFVPRLFAPDLSWEDVTWLRDAWPGKLLIKGILDSGDAQRAAELGCDGIILSNHGGRQLDSCVSPMDVLPDIAKVVGNRLTILVDSGFRRGTDIIKALALGADAVMLGRAVLYGLAAGGEAGARHALSLLTSEVDRVMGQLGCVSLKDVGPHLLTTV